MIFESKKNPVFLAMSTHFVLFSFSCSVRIASKTLELHKLHPPTDCSRDNVTRRARGSWMRFSRVAESRERKETYKLLLAACK